MIGAAVGGRVGGGGGVGGRVGGGGGVGGGGVCGAPPPFVELPFSSMEQMFLFGLQ